MIPKSPEGRRRYLGRAVLRAGVQEPWVEDAIQHVEIVLWRNGKNNSAAIWRASIDAARKYGPRTRDGNPRYATSIDAMMGDWDRADAEYLAPSYDPYVGLAEQMDRLSIIKRVLAACSPRKRECFLRECQGEVLNDADRAQAWVVKRRVRAA